MEGSMTKLGSMGLFVRKRDMGVLGRKVGQ